MSERDQGPDQPMTIASAGELLRPATRRQFVRMLGVGGTIVMLPSVFAACDDDDTPTGNGNQSPPPPPVTAITFDLRTDIGIFRFAHTLEQLEAAFYTAVVADANFNTFFNAVEREILTDIRNHEIVHREFLRTALGASAVPDITSALNTTTLATILSTRANILNTARMFEDTGVAAYNGAGKYLQNANNLLVAGKIVSVEARHAAVIRDLAPPAGATATTAFAGDDVVDVTTGRDVKLEPATVIAKVAATNIFKAGVTVTISNPPSAAQGAASADFFPANP
jgi:hypothetical protein